MHKQYRTMSQTRLPLLLLLTSTLAAIPVLQATVPGVRILRAPESIVAPTGDEVVFECETSLPPESFKWSFRQSQNVTNRPLTQRFKYLKVGNSKVGPYNITDENSISKLRVFVSQETIGEYRCVGLFGPLAVTSTTARLQSACISLAENSISEPKIMNWRVPAGNDVFLQCGQVTSQPPPTWSFYRNKIEIKSDVVNGTLVLPAVSEEHSGKYTCAATNTVSSIKIQLPRIIALEVSVQVGSSSPHFLTGQLLRPEVNAREGDTVLLLCPGVGKPKPIAVWSRLNGTTALRNNRTHLLPYGLQIVNVQSEDTDSYICYLDNGIRPALKHVVNLTVEQPPRITHAPSANLTNEGDMLQLECRATGVPAPDIYWLLNGESSINDSEVKMYTNGSLVLRSVQKRHAGYVQCFARNSLGEQSAGTLLQVNPKQIQGEPKHTGGNRQVRPSHGRKQTHMEPPSAPNVTRLTDESVMLRWHVARNDGLNILFFKVQYRMLTEGGKRKNWQTTNDNIPYGKPKWNSEQGKSFTASVSNLKPQRWYRFRIMAVYSNKDNKESHTSAKFFLQRGSTLEPLPVPELVDIEEHSETAVVLHWRLSSDADEQIISGYYAYYRPSSSAGEYFKATIEGARSRSFQIATLEAGTIYEFKLQSFSAVSASDFSALKQGRTQKLKSTTTEQPTAHHVDTTTPNHNETFNVNPMLTGTIGGGALLLLLLITACLCICRRRSARVNEVNKPCTAELREDFVPLGACTPSKTRPRHIHITLNPLAQHEEKSSPVLPDNEITYFQRQPANDVEHQLAFNGHSRMSASLRRSQRTLERSVSSSDDAVGIGGNNNNHNQAMNCGLATATDSPRMQPSSKPTRVILKRTRLSSRSDNLSSGSLNSVGV